MKLKYDYDYPPGRPRKYPKMWICHMCGQKFPNKTGRPRKYCSQKCYGRLLSKRPPLSTFKSGPNHHFFFYKNGKQIRKKETIFNPEQRNKIAKKSHFKCNICGFDFFVHVVSELRNKGAVFDHIISVWKGGETTVKNGQLICKKCDEIKNKKEAKERWNLWVISKITPVEKLKTKLSHETVNQFTFVKSKKG